MPRRRSRGLWVHDEHFEGHPPIRALRMDDRVSLFACAAQNELCFGHRAFSFLGITLGVATLIVVMSVMNGFHKELLDKIVGINGHVFLQATDTQFTDFDEVVKEVAAVPGVELVVPM